MTLSDQPQTEMNDLEDALRARICSVCVDRNMEGGCHLEEEHECALFSSFPKIVQAVSSVQSDLMEDYVRAIRSTVCEECSHQDVDGFCRVRGEVRCVLDRYLLLIVQTIEKVRGVTLQPVSRLHHIISRKPEDLQTEGQRGTSSVVKEQSDA